MKRYYPILTELFIALPAASITTFRFMVRFMPMVDCPGDALTLIACMAIVFTTTTALTIFICSFLIGGIKRILSKTKTFKGMQ